uniref:Uncharacterized protein n=1 Tax=Oncorhynchus kisutch TaxID=8019 RepID=A0A8C7HSC4_ONCKI
PPELLPDNLMLILGINEFISISFYEQVTKDLSRGIVEKKLAACVNIVPKITSVYEWQGKIQEDSEVLLMIKTRSSKISIQMSFRCNVDIHKQCHSKMCPDTLT